MLLTARAAQVAEDRDFTFQAPTRFRSLGAGDLAERSSTLLSGGLSDLTLKSNLDSNLDVHHTANLVEVPDLQ